jgi:glycosyltransferase involved in cell wall biosynthesis
LSRKIKVLYLGSFLSSKRGTVSVAEKLSKEMAQQHNSSVEIILVSTIVNRVFRAFHVFWAVLFYDYDYAFIDVFSGNSFKLASITSSLLKLRGKSVYLVIRGGNFINYFNQNRIKVIKTLNRAQKLFSPSLMICDYFTSCNYDIHYLPNYIDRKNFPIGEVSNRNQHSILWVRAFSTIYNPELAIRIFNLVCQKLPQATLSMVGPDLGELENTTKLVLELGLSDKIKFIGPVPNRELYKLYHSHSVYLNTTSFESFGMSLMEAASCGIPIVSSDVGEISKIWTTEVNAMLFPLDNIHLASEHIINLMENQAFYNGISQSAQLNVNAFDKAKLIPVWQSIFANCGRTKNLPGLLFIGSFLSSSKGTIGPSEQISRELRNKRYYIQLTSVIASKKKRLLNMLENILFGTRNIKFLHIDVFSGNAFYYAFFCALVGRVIRKKYILTLHGGMLPEFYLGHKILFGKLMNNASLIATPSFYLKGFFEEHSFKVEYIPNPLDLKKFKISNTSNTTNKDNVTFKILWVRAFTEIYNPFFALNVLKLVRDSGLNATLTMVGPDLGMMDAAKVVAKELGVINFVDFTGPIKNRELPEYYQSHDCYINTTSYESFGVSLMEAACCGLPICSNRVGEIPFLWKDRIEYLGNEPNNGSQMAENIIKLAQNINLRNMLVQNALQKSTIYEVSAVVKLWDDKLSQIT